LVGVVVGCCLKRISDLAFPSDATTLLWCDIDGDFEKAFSIRLLKFVGTF